MIQIIKEINVEVTKPNIFQALVAKQYDMNTRFLKVTLMDCGDRIDVPATETTRVVINAERKDGQSKGFDGEINEDGTVTVPLHSWMLELDGTVNCDISVIDTATDNNKKLTTTTFALLVEKAAYGGDGITSDPQYDVLIELINSCNEVIEKANKESVGKKTAEGGEIFNDYHLNAAGPNAHAEGTETKAYGENSHTSGRRTIAGYDNQFVCGQLNENKEDTLFEVGNGYSNEDEGNVQSNAFEVYKDGHAEVQTQGETENSVVTKKYVDDVVASGGGTSSGGVSKEYVDSHLEGISDLVSDNQDDIINLGERTETLETDVETIKQSYVSLDYIKNTYPDAQTVDRRIAEYVDPKTENIPVIETNITNVESDIIAIEEDIAIIREDFATKQYVEEAVASSGGGGVSSWNDLTYKPFYDEHTTLTLDYANPPAVGIDFNGVFLGKVTDDLLTTDHIDGAEVSIYFPTDSTVESISGVINIDTLMMFPLPFGTGYQLSGDNFFCMIAVATQTGEVDFDGMTYNIPETGTYLGFMHYSGATPNSMSLEYNFIKTLDIKFIPDGLYTEIDQRIEDYINEALGGDY